jgi:phage tail P2-like protein
MSDLTELLPGNSGTFEKALAKTIIATLPVPLDLEMNPYSASERNLPYLAEHHGVDYWYDDWDESRKRQMIAHCSGRRSGFEGEFIQELKGTRLGTIRYLEYANGTLLDTISYPQRVVLGRSVIRKAPIGHPAFAARHLVKVPTTKPPRAAVLGRGVLGRSPVKTPDRTPLERARIAMRTAKAPHTEYRVDWAHKRIINIDDQIDIDAGFHLGDYVDRTRL